MDMKFIVCSLSSTVKSVQPNENTLILIDQHAADERIRVERYIKELCSGYLDRCIKTEKINPPLRIVLTARESSRLQDDSITTRLLRQWGFDVRPPSSADQINSQIQEDFAQHSVYSIPSVLSNKVGQAKIHVHV